MSGNLDDLDRQILSILMTDGRMPNVQIASRVGSSETTVRRRIQNLLDKGVMEVVAVANPEELGLNIHAVVAFDVELAKGHQIAKALCALKPVRYLAYLSGHYDFIAHAYFASEQELFEFLTDEIAHIPGIINTETFRVLKIAKRTWNYLDGDLLEQVASLPS